MFLQSVLVLVLGLVSVTLNAFAKDIVDEQYQVRVAQKEYDNAKRDYDALANKIQIVEQRLSQFNAQLESFKKDLPSKEDRLNKAKTNLDEKTKLLDKVWEENHLSR